MISVYDRFPERKARATASAERLAKLHAKQQRIRELEARLSEASGAPANSAIKQLALALIGGTPDPDSAESLRQEWEQLRKDTAVLKEAVVMDSRWLDEFDNRHSGEICAERRPEFDKLYRDYFAARIAGARVATKLAEMHRQNAADGILAHSGFIPQLVHGSGPFGYGKDDLSYTESAICHQIREAVRHGYLDSKDQILIGVNWRRN